MSAVRRVARLALPGWAACFWLGVAQAEELAPHPAGSLALDSAAPAGLDFLKDVRFWSTVYAGHSTLEGDADLGTQKVVASVLGLSWGADFQPNESTLLGASLGLSRQTFSSTNGNGNSKDVSLALYGRRILFDHAYVTAALGFGLHHVETRREVDVFSTVLEANYHAHDLGGRVEGGYTLNLGDNWLVAPFGALVADSYRQPSYDEAATSGLQFLAASFAAKSFDVTHFELGSRVGHSFALDNGKSLAVDAIAAWEHELDDNPYVIASFQAFPGSSFVVPGTRPARESALLGGGLRFQDSDRLTFGLRSDARVGAGTTIFSGTADITYRW